MQGKVKWFNPKKGYGFICREDDKDIFIHFSQIKTEGFKTLKDGDTVEFDLVELEKGPQAKNVTKFNVNSF